MRIQRLLFLIIFFQLNSCLVVNAQDNSWIEGKIIDGASRKPIPFATIKLKNRAMGVISNSDGDFQIPSRFKLLQDTLIVSCIGYNTRVVNMSSLISNDLNIIRLTESVNRLSEVEVRGKRLGRLTAFKIVELAIHNIEKNFPYHPFCYEAYYRDYQVLDSAYTNLNEAIVKVQDSGFQTFDQRKTKIRLYEYKKNSGFERDPTTEIAYDNKDDKFVPNATLKSFGGNELTILRVHDPIRNNDAMSFSFIDNFKDDFLNNHFFSMGDQAYLDKVPLYCVNFVSKSSVTGNQHIAKGKIYIEHNNFAIHKLEYVTYETLGNNILYDLQLEYSRTTDRMYLNYISFNNFFKIRDPKDFKIIDKVYDRGTNVLTISVNNLPDPISALKVRNYRLLIDGVKLYVAEVRILPTNKKEILLVLKENRRFKRWEDRSKMSPRLSVIVKGVKDTNGKELDKPTYIPINQFRELFTQEINTEGCNSNNDTFMDKFKPLFQNIVSSNSERDHPNWMNTPLRKKQ